RLTCRQPRQKSLYCLARSQQAVCRTPDVSNEERYDMEINGHKAIIVGGASGMALATAEAFVAKGGSVAILDLPKSNGAAEAERLGGTFHPCNVTDFAGTETVINEAAAALGGVHFLCNTAGGGIAK